MNPNLPLVSVLMPLFNKEQYIAEAITSVLNQTYQNIELIVVDDGSTDDGFNIALKFASENVHVYKQANQGASEARNKAFSLSKGDFIQYLDADDLLDSNKIEEQVKRIYDKPGTIATAHWQYFAQHIEEDRHDENAILMHDFDDMTDFLLKITRRGFPIHAWLIPREAIIKAGQWDKSIYIFEDRDFYLRLMPLVKSVIFCERAFCYYRMPQKGRNLSVRRDEQVLIGSLKYIDNAEKSFFKIQNEEAKQTLACLYKKLLLVATNDKKIIKELRHRSVRLKIAPNCGKNAIIKWCEKLLGVRATFELIYFQAKYLSK